MKTHVAERVKQVKEEFAREEESESSELGEGDSTVAKKESFGIFDATAEDIDNDLTVDYKPEEAKPTADATVDDLLGKMKADVHNNNPLDDATEFLQYEAAHDGEFLCVPKRWPSLCSQTSSVSESSPRDPVFSSQMWTLL